MELSTHEIDPVVPPVDITRICAASVGFWKFRFVADAAHTSDRSKSAMSARGRVIFHLFENNLRKIR
jgi:hypothetical protein